MKKLTLLFMAAAMISGGAFAQDKACCKKSGSCTKSACCKDKKSCAKDAKTTSTVKAQAKTKA